MQKYKYIFYIVLEHHQTKGHQCDILKITIFCWGLLKMVFYLHLSLSEWSEIELCNIVKYFHVHLHTELYHCVEDFWKLIIGYVRRSDAIFNGEGALDIASTKDILSVEKNCLLIKSRLLQVYPLKWQCDN